MTDQQLRNVASLCDYLGITDLAMEVLQCRLDHQSGRATPANVGHGHVVPRPDGAKARCGGPAICAQCAREAAAQSGRAAASEDR